jgi:[lysine-biosynthesis-protein LysW]--L-2-aminoadipate ligase
MAFDGTRPLAVLTSRVRTEEKMLLSRLERRRVPFEVVDTRRAVFRPGEDKPAYRAALSREISHTRNLYTARLLEHAGVPVVNTADVISVCGDKLLTTLALIEAGVPVPRCLVGLTPDAAAAELEEFGLPAVVKPLTGSWGRLVSRLDNRAAAEAVLEHRAALPGPHHQITYVQEYIDKPDRDIKVYVMGDEVIAAIYRRSTTGWRTNTALNGSAAPCPVDDDLAGLVLAAAKAVGGGVLGVDVLEDRDGRRYVNEVNHTPEFHGAIRVLPMDLVDPYLDYVLRWIDDR